ncbi:unnamed protein product [Leptidea sinapis]|uniref:Uncharacterized protein n=1 Tax=Leptidea sinapis TaxID=189913 RepID=A0A5E4QRJ9_9NEOP|nr:unnamed protein product [Leptidea sinapis]
MHRSQKILVIPKSSDESSAEEANDGISAREDNSERLLREAVEEKRKELEELEALALFTPRKSLARTPPGGFGSVEELRQGAEKRSLQSPEVLQEALRRKLEPSTSGQKSKDGMSMKDQDIENLIELANTAGSTIMSAATGPTNKLNKADLGLIGTQVQRLTAVVATLAGRLLKAKETERAVTITAGVTSPRVHIREYVEDG